MTAIILDGEAKSALAAARALGARGIDVVVGSTHRTACTRFSKYTKERFIYPSPLLNQEEFVNAVVKKAQTFSPKPVLFSFSDATFLPLSRNREKILACARMTLPSEEDVERAYDKSETMRLARGLGILIPRTWMPKRIQDLPALSSAFPFPLVVKPRHSVSWKQGRRGIKGVVVFAHSHDDLESTIQKIEKRTGEMPILQELVKGGEYGIEAFALNGEVKALCAHRRIRSLSPTGGASVVKESIKPPKDMTDCARRLLKELLWSGVAMIEFKRDKEEGNQPLLLEINGRFWGSLPLAVKSGVDFPYLYYHERVGNKKTVTELSCTPGVSTRHLLGDIKHLLRVLFSKDKMRPVLFPSRTEALRSFLFSFTIPDDVFSLHDPLPFVMEGIDRLLH